MQNILSKNHAPFPSIAFTLSSNPSLRRTSATHDLSVYFRVAYLLTSTSKGSFLRFPKNFERFLWNTTDFVMAGLPRKAASSATDALVQEEETASKAFVPLGEWTITKDVPLSSSRGGRTDWMPQSQPMWYRSRALSFWMRMYRSLDANNNPWGMPAWKHLAPKERDTPYHS